MRSPIAYAGNPLDRAGNQRRDPEWMAARLADPRARVLPIARSGALVSGGRLVFLARETLDVTPDEVLLLGLDGEAPIFATNVTGREADHTDRGDFIDLRSAGGLLSREELAIAGQAVWLTGWHFRHPYCAKTGAPTRPEGGGQKRIEPESGTEHFPRIDPVAIVLPVDGDAVCLGRGPHFPEGIVSAFAGFVEPGETLEECAVRELREEAGLHLTGTTYLFSQPWPFPASLMCGFLADVRDRILRLDPVEIAEARWFGRSEIETMLAGEDASGYRIPPATTIAHQLLKAWAER